jgi:hypothetical protein
VTRREYAELVVRLGSLELQAQRNRARLEVQGERIAQMQEQLDMLRASRGQSPAADIRGIAMPPPPATVES